MVLSKFQLIKCNQIVFVYTFFLNFNTSEQETPDSEYVSIILNDRSSEEFIESISTIAFAVTKTQNREKKRTFKQLTERAGKGNFSTNALYIIWDHFGDREKKIIYL